MLNLKAKGYGFAGMAGFNNRKKGSISNGDWDRDGVKNKKDCKPFDYKKQDTCSRCGISYAKADGGKIKSANGPLDVCGQCLIEAHMVSYAGASRY